MSEPTIPEELWMLWGFQGGAEPVFLLAINDTDGADDYLCYFSKEDAMTAAMAHMEKWDVGCTPVRVK